ncbi:MAG: protein kinase domain-containing protein [Solirubrobacterales bacterium]
MSEATTGTAGALTGTVLSSRYRLEQKLGSGGMSTVYLARDETLERWVAAKVLHREISDQPDQIERFRREARAVAQVSHPNVVAVIDAGEDGGRPYIVFEYVEGVTLKQRIDEAGRLPLDEATAYAIEVGRGLAAAHARMLVHRDVKPQNVLIDPDGRAKVTDFGIARSLESDGLTATGRVLGTTDYVSPEQAMGREVDARSDIYALGVVLWEMLVGEPPFKAETLVGVAMKHVNEEMPDVQRRRREVSSALAAVVERATEKDPKKRYPEMGAMLADLEGALEVEVARAGTSHGEATTVLDSVPERRLTPRRASIAGILLVLAGTAAALLIAGLTGDEDRRGGGVSGDATGEEIALNESGTTDFDPNGTGTPGELPDLVRLATDGDPTGTAWATEHYDDSPDVAALKGGVGIYVEAEEPVAPEAMEVRTEVGGWAAEVYAVPDSPPETIEGWGDPIGQLPNADTDSRIDLTADVESSYFLLWFTTLPESSENSSRYRAEVSDIALFD